VSKLIPIYPSWGFSWFYQVHLGKYPNLMIDYEDYLMIVFEDYEDYLMIVFQLQGFCVVKWDGKMIMNSK